MFLITGSFKTGCLFLGLGCSLVPIYFCADPETFKIIISNLFNTKYLEFLVYKSDAAVADKTVTVTPPLPAGTGPAITKTSKIPAGKSHFDFLKEENLKKRKSIDDLSQSKSDLYKNGRKNYKCAITLTDLHFAVFDNDCLIYKINKQVKKSSEILSNLELVKSKYEVEHDQMYVLKINGNSLKHTKFSDEKNKFTHDRNMVVEVLEKDANIGDNENRMFYLNLNYALTNENWWFGRTNFALVSGKSKDNNISATANDEKICKNTFSNETDCIIFSIKDTTTATKTGTTINTITSASLKTLKLSPITKTESSNDLNDDKYYIVYYPNEKYGVPRSVSISRDYGYYKYTETDDTDTKGRIIELQYHKMLMGSINLQDLTKSQLFVIDQWPK